MKLALALTLCLTGVVHGQMEKRHLALYRLEKFLRRSPTVGAPLETLKLRDLAGKQRVYPTPRPASGGTRRPLVIIGGAYT